ncbi:hypothetical protein ACIA5G_51780 [Amycolatopsis sp. NPDC051758]|uniref:hypothetical protein n=1 Tax=Amycolatopsis sp. NPDC051758 TaxID=3363935 RepID=UPI0037ABC790
MSVRTSLVALAVMIGGGLAATTGVAAAGTTSDCTYNTSASGVNFHVKCSRLPAGYGQYRAYAQCGNGAISYGIWTTVADSKYIGPVADCSNRGNVAGGGIQLRCKQRLAWPGQGRAGRRHRFGVNQR